jgi:hypothetical protein
MIRNGGWTTDFLPLFPVPKNRRTWKRKKKQEEELGALGICYDVKVLSRPAARPLFNRPFSPECDRADQTTRPAPGARFGCAVQVVQQREREKKREREREAGTHLLLATGMETVAVDSSSVPFGMSASFFIRPHLPPPPTPDHPLPPPISPPTRFTK